MRQGWCSGRAVGLALWLGLLSGCASPGSERIVGPDGSAMAHVHCGAQQGECFRIAGELCPSGYEMQPVLSGSDGNFLVRCRAAGAAVAAAACAAPAPAPAPPASLAASAPSVVASAPSGPSHRTTGSVAAQDRWPPATEPWPATYPWPPPETNVTAHAPSKTPSTPPGDVDIGY